MTEYLSPHKDLAKFCPNTVNCIRYLTGRLNGKLVPLISFIRFGTAESKFVENYNAGGVLCYIDDQGEFNEGNVLDRCKFSNSKIFYHPDNGEKLYGKIPLWEDIKNVVKIIDTTFPQLEYL